MTINPQTTYTEHIDCPLCDWRYGNEFTYSGKPAARLDRYQWLLQHLNSSHGKLASIYNPVTQFSYDQGIRNYDDVRIVVIDES